MWDNEVVVRKRKRELMFQTVWSFREGIHLTSHPRVLADRQVVALTPYVLIVWLTGDARKAASTCTVVP